MAEETVSWKYNIPGTMCFALEGNSRLHREDQVRASAKLF